MSSRWLRITRDLSRPVATLIALPALVAVLALLLITVDLWGEYRHAVGEAETVAMSEARAVAEQAGRTADAMAGLLFAVGSESERSGVDRAAPRRRGDLGDQLMRLSSPMRSALSLYAVDDRGRVSASWESLRPVGAAAPEAVLRAARRPGTSGLWVSEPYHQDGVWFVAMVRRQENAAGRGLSLAVAELQLEQFLRGHPGGPASPAGVKALYRADGLLLAEAGPDMVRPEGPALAVQDLPPGHEGAVFRMPADGEADARIAAWHRVSGHPIIAVASVDRWGVLGAWRVSLACHLAALVVVVAALALVSLLLRRQVRQAQHSNLRLRAAVDASMDAFFVLHGERDGTGDIVDFRFIDTNPNGEIALGLPRAAIVNELLSKIAPRGHFESMRETYAVVVESGHPIEEELVVEGANGPEWMQHQIVRLEDGVAITSRNVSERRRAEEKAIAAEMRVAEIAASLPGAVLQYRREADGTFRFTYASQSIARLCGLSPRDLESDSGALLRLALPEDKAAFQKAISVSARRLAPLRLDYRSRSPDGVRWLRIDALPKRRSNGAVAWSGLLTDVTAEKEAEGELETAKLEAEEASHTKSAFLANMSHELRTPLNAIIGFSEGLGAGVFGPMLPKQREYVEDIRSAGTHLLQIINDLLDLSKIEAGKAKLYEEPVVIGDIVDSAMALLRGHAIDKGIRLEADVAPDLPTVLADEIKLKQILVNLLSNAVKFTPTHGTVSILAAPNADGGVLMRVRDTGHGIAEEDLEKVLEPFWQAEGSHVRKVGGTGLGLPLVKHLIAMHGGTIDIQSALGSGTTVTVNLPASRVITASAWRRSMVRQ